ncbi:MULTISPECIES: hypothetical protein [Nostocales]|nr:MULTISPECIES: hypothetical protein [Nostocales]
MKYVVDTHALIWFLEGNIAQIAEALELSVDDVKKAAQKSE